MSPVPLTFNPKHTRHLDRSVRSIDVTRGTLIVLEGEKTTKVKEGSTFEAKDAAADLTLTSPDGAAVAVAYSDEVPEVPDKDHLEYELQLAEERKVLAADQNNAVAVEAAEAKEHQARRLLETNYPEEAEQKSAKKASSKKPKSSSRGDTGGTTGSYESRSLKELQAVAKERGITGVSKLSKDKLIKRLRG